MDILEVQRLFVEQRCVLITCKLPCSNIGKVVVVAQRLTIRRLILTAEVSATRLIAMQGINADQLTHLQEICHAASLLKGLIQIV